jgi:hypothetical protein
MAKAYKRLRRERTERRLKNQSFMEPSKRPLTGKRKKSFIRSLFSKDVSDPAGRYLLIALLYKHKEPWMGYPPRAAMALRPGKLCGNCPTLWLNLQRDVDLWQQRRRLSKAIERIPTLHAHA